MSATAFACSHKSMREFETLAKEQGWRVEATNGGHVMWYPPDKNKQAITTSSTPSDEGIIKTIRSQLTKAGLILDRTEWRRRQRELSKDAPFCLPPQGRISTADERAQMNPQVLNDALLSVYGKTDELLVFTDWQQELLLELLTDDGEFQRHCRCGKEYVDPIGFAAHLHNFPGDEAHGPRLAADPEPDPPVLDAEPDKETDQVAHDDPGDEIAEPAAFAPPLAQSGIDLRSLPVPPLSADATDDELWALLEMVLDQPVTLDRHTLAVVNAWLDATKALLRLKNGT